MLGLAGCASVDNDVKVPQGSYLSHVLFMNVANDPHRPKVTDSTETKLEWLMPLVEIDTEGFIHPQGLRVKDASSQDKSPTYIAYDISRLELGQFDELFPGTDPSASDADQATAAQARNTAILRIIHLSDYNFDAYTLRGQCYEDSEKLASDTLNTVGTATIGGTALTAPPAAAGLALTKLLIDSSNTNVQNSFLGGQTTDVLFKAMAANRATFKTQIINKLFATKKPSTYQSYRMLWALDDIRQLNRISTLHGALEAIAQQATTQTQAATTTSNEITSTQTHDTPAALSDKLSATTPQAVTAVPKDKTSP